MVEGLPHVPWGIGVGWCGRGCWCCGSGLTAGWGSCSVGLVCGRVGCLGGRMGVGVGARWVAWLSGVVRGGLRCAGPARGPPPGVLAASGSARAGSSSRRAGAARAGSSSPAEKLPRRCDLRHSSNRHGCLLALRKHPSMAGEPARPLVGTVDRTAGDDRSCGANPLTGQRTARRAASGRPGARLPLHRTTVEISPAWWSAPGALPAATPGRAVADPQREEPILS